LSMMNDYRKGWALRYLREAKAELTAAQKTPYMAPSLIFEALRKAQAAIYYSLGEPTFIATIVHETLYTKQFVEDPILKFLVEIERTVQQTAQKPRSDSEAVMEQVNGLVQLASEIVELFTGETA
jgi:methylase of polypeptide subunit release factors